MNSGPTYLKVPFDGKEVTWQVDHCHQLYVVERCTHIKFTMEKGICYRDAIGLHNPLKNLGCDAFSVKGLHTVVLDTRTV